MCDLNKMLDRSRSVSIDDFLSYSMDVQIQGIELMFDKEDCLDDFFQPWAYLYLKGVKYNDLGSIMALEDEFDVSLEIFQDHRSIVNG